MEANQDLEEPKTPSDVRSPPMSPCVASPVTRLKKFFSDLQDEHNRRQKYWIWKAGKGPPHIDLFNGKFKGPLTPGRRNSQRKTSISTLNQSRRNSQNGIPSTPSRRNSRINTSIPKLSFNQSRRNSQNGIPSTPSRRNSKISTSLSSIPTLSRSRRGSQNKIPNFTPLSASTPRRVKRQSQEIQSSAPENSRTQAKKRRLSQVDTIVETPNLRLNYNKKQKLNATHDYPQRRRSSLGFIPRQSQRRSVSQTQEPPSGSQPKFKHASLFKFPSVISISNPLNCDIPQVTPRDGGSPSRSFNYDTSFFTSPSPRTSPRRHSSDLDRSLLSQAGYESTFCSSPGTPLSPNESDLDQPMGLRRMYSS